jgi:hypothetical protein
MTPDEKSNKIVDLALTAGRYRRERDAAVAACAGCPTCAERIRRDSEQRAEVGA